MTEPQREVAEPLAQSRSDVPDHGEKMPLQLLSSLDANADKVPAIEVKGLFKVFGAHAKHALALVKQGKTKEAILEKTGAVLGIEGADFQVQKGEIFVVMGLSGSGKSTLIRCLNRLIEPSCGEVLIDGENILSMNNKQLIELRRSKISMVFQHFGLLPHRTVQKNVEYGLEVSGVDRETCSQKALQALDLVGLKTYADNYPRELSGGMQQRVGLARALANEPEILLMDEAFSALDPLIRSEMQDELIALQSKMHKTIVFITHDLDEALKLGDRIAIMKNGQVVQVGTPEEILTQPADDYVASFVERVDRSKVMTAESIMDKAVSITMPQSGSRVAVRVMEKNKLTHIFVVDIQRRVQGLLSLSDAIALEHKGISSVESALKRNLLITTTDTLISDLLASALESNLPLAVTDKEGRLVGRIEKEHIFAEFIDQDRGEGPATFTEYQQTILTTEEQGA